jgi:hypothetical protein
VPEVTEYEYDLQEYLKTQHNIEVQDVSQLDQDDFPWLSFGLSGKPTLYEDKQLHEKLQLPDAYRVVTGKTGVYHKAYDAEKVQPKFANITMHNSEMVTNYY